MLFGLPSKIISQNGKNKKLESYLQNKKWFKRKCNLGSLFFKTILLLKGNSINGGDENYKKKKKMAVMKASLFRHGIINKLGF